MTLTAGAIFVVFFPGRAHQNPSNPRFQHVFTRLKKILESIGDGERAGEALKQPSQALYIYILSSRTYQKISLGEAQICESQSIQGKKVIFFIETSGGLRNDQKRFLSTRRHDCYLAYAADGPTTPPEL